MVIDLGSGSLFKPQGLEQDTGLLKDRWGQDGSEIQNFAVSLAADTTVLTVPTGQRFHVDTVNSIATTAAVNYYLRDGGVSGTVRTQGYSALNVPTSLPIVTPLYFDTDCYLDVSTGNVGIVTITGWLEPAP